MRAAVAAMQMTGGGRHVVLGPCHADSMHPDLDWLEAELAGPTPPKLVVLVNPCNPTGGCLHQSCLPRAPTQEPLLFQRHQPVCDSRLR